MSPIEFAERGWYVFPIKPNTKFPYKGFEWRKKSTNDPKLIQRVLEHPKYADCRWAVDCHKSKITVFDVDAPKGGIESLRKLPPMPDDGFAVKTPRGGFHFFFEDPGQVGRNSSGDLDKGLDTRGDGGYAVLPTPGSGYEVLQAGAPAPQPEWLRSFFAAKANRAQSAAVGTGSDASGLIEVPPDEDHNIKAAIEYLTNRAPDAEEGTRNNTLVQVCRTLRDRGVSCEKAIELISDHWNEASVHPPLDQIEIERTCKSAYRNCANAFGCATPEAIFSEADPFRGESPPTPEQDPLADGEPEKQEGPIRCAADINPAHCKPRPWLLGHRYLPEYVTVTIAPGGTGKSLLTILEGLAVASGRKLTHDTVHRKANVWLYNTEDPFDELERRVVAAARHHAVSRHEMRGFFYSSGYENPLKLAQSNGGSIVKNEKAIERMVREIEARKVGLLIIDPFVETHWCDENSNMEMSSIVQIFRGIAKRTGCAVSIVHHTTKGRAEPGNVDRARGAGAIVNTARIAHTLYDMSEAEARVFGVDPSRACWYARLDPAKRNLAPPESGGQWFEKRSIEVAEDTTGVMVPVVLGGSHGAQVAQTLLWEMEEKGGESMGVGAAVQLLIKSGFVGAKGGASKRAVESMLRSLFGFGEGRLETPDGGCVWLWQEKVWGVKPAGLECETEGKGGSGEVE